MAKYIQKLYLEDGDKTYDVDTRGIVNAKDKATTLEDRLQNIEIDKQNKLTAGTGINIADDGTISVSFPEAEDEEF